MALESLNKIKFNVNAFSIADISRIADVKNITTVFNELQSISKADYGDFRALKIQESAVVVSALSDELQASTLMMNGFSEAETRAVLSVNGLTDAEIEQALAFVQSGESIKLYNAELIKSGLQNSTLSSTEQKLVLDKLGLIDATTGELISTKQVSQAKLEEALINSGLEASESSVTAERIISTFAQGTQKTSIETILALTKKQIIENTKYIASMVATHPVATALSVALAALGGAILYNIHKEKEYQKALEESVDSMSSATSKYSNSVSKLDELREKYKALEKQLSSTNLTEEETYHIKSDLYDVQCDLIDNFGNETKGIDLVNGKYREQLGLLQQISKESAEAYLTKNKEDYDNNISYLTDKEDFRSKYTSEWSSKNSGYMSDDLKNLLETNGLTIDAEHWRSELGGAFTKYYVEFEDVTREEAYNLAMRLGEVLRSAGEENVDLMQDPYYDLVLSYLSYVTTELIDESRLNSAKENADYYEKLSAMYSSSFGDLYNSFVDARDEYLKALQTSKNVDNARINFENIYGEFQNSSKVKSNEIKNAFADVRNSIDEELVKLNNWEKSLSGSNELDIISSLKVTDDQLRGINWDDEFASPTEEAFGNLLTYLGASREDIEQVISLLVKMGAVIGEKNVKGGTFNDEYPISFSSALSDESLSKFQSTIDSLKSSLTTLYNGDYSSTELISALTNINKAMSDISIADSLSWEELTNLDDLDDIIDQITNEYVDGMLDSLDMAGTDFGNTIRNVIQEELNASRQLETYKNNVSDLQSAYIDLTDVIETYNETGYITFDQLTSLLEMEPQYLSCLIDENGQLQLNQKSMLALANQRLNDAEAQAVQQAITELGQLALQDEKTAVEENAQAFSNAVNDLASYNDELAGTIGETSIASSVIRDLNDAINGAESRGATDVQIDTVLDNLNTKLQLIRNTRLNLDKSLSGIVSGKSSSSSSPSSTDDFKEQFDFFERRVKVLDNAVSLLKANLENLTGSFAKNQLLDQNSNLLEERVRNYSDAAKMYQQKALESLSRLDLETQSKIINGSVSLKDYIGEDSKAVTQAMNDYKGWADKVADCTEELASLQTQLRQLELDKFNHIVQDFTDQFDLRDNTKGLIDKQIALFEEAGQLVGKAFYEQQISQTQKQLSLLETEKVQLVNQLNTALASGRIQKGTEEWLEMVKALSDVDGNILDCKKSIETFDNAIQNLHWEVFDRVQDTFGNLSDEISNLLGTMKNAEVATPDNQWTAEGLTQLGLYAQQYELATYQATQYADEIDRLNADYLAGKYSATEYADKLADLSSAQWKAVNAAESAKDSILDLNETRVGVVSDGIQKEIDAYKELIDSQTEALGTEKELHEYQNSIAEKSGNIAKMEKQLAAMQNDTTAAAVAKRKQLEEQLAQARADLEETQYQHSVETQKESLNQQYENYETARNQEIESLEESLKDKETIIAVSMESVKQNTQIIAGQITEIANQHGIKVSTALTNSWASGENAIASYGEVLSQQTSAFIGNIMAVETQIYQLQADADITALSLANMFGATADNLVGQLNASYFAETNLLNMTNALQNSLVNTLQGEYNVSNIVNSLNAVTNAAQKAKEALEATLQPISPPTIPGETTKSLPGMAAAVAAGNTGILKKYASGTRNITSNQLALTNESGQEIIYRTKDGSILTRLQPGDKVFSNAAVERLWNIGQGIVPHDILKGSAMPPVLPNNISSHSPVNIHYDSMLTFTGDVNDTNHFTKQVRAVAKEVMTDTIKLAEKTRKYGMF